MSALPSVVVSSAQGLERNESGMIGSSAGWRIGDCVLGAGNLELVS